MCYTLNGRLLRYCEIGQSGEVSFMTEEEKKMINSTEMSVCKTEELKERMAEKSWARAKVKAIDLEFSDRQRPTGLDAAPLGGCKESCPRRQ